MKRIFAATILAFISYSAFAAHGGSCELDLKESFTADSKITKGEAHGKINNTNYSITKNCEASFSGGETTTPSANLKYQDSWLIRCSLDPISDVKKCMLHRSSLSLFIQSDGVVAIKIGTDVYPSSDVFIRVDDEGSLSSKEGFFHGDAALSVIDKLSNGTKATTKYYKWPSYFEMINSVELTGFKEAVQFIEWAIPRINKAK